MLFINLIFSIILLSILFNLVYYYILAFASLLPLQQSRQVFRPIRIAIAIPAHNEETVIARTVTGILDADYPSEMISIYVVADHCTDLTAQAARRAGATVFERSGEIRGGKGPALAWLFQKIFESGENYQVITIFDADTQVHPGFFNRISERILAGSQAIQGNHIIRNQQAGWFPALTWAMFLIDNRYQNLGRSNLRLSAKNMGDSISFQTDILKRFGWGTGLTEDYEFRQKLLLKGIRIDYEPGAIGYGDAALNWHEAQAQRTRWVAGARQASKSYGLRMLKTGLKLGNLPLIDGALQAYLPSYSTLTMLCGGMTLIAWMLTSVSATAAQFWSWLPLAYFVAFILLFLFPLINLAFERAPIQAYFVILTGPVYIVWRTWLTLLTRIRRSPVTWVRTPRH